MTMNFHEQYSVDDARLPSDRSTGLVFAASAGIIAYLWRSNPTLFISALSVAGIMLTVSLLAPHFLKPLNIAWFRLARLLNKIVQPVIMLVLFFAVIVPAGLIMQTKSDPLRKRRSKDIKSYWIERGKDWPASNMTNQF